jgi:class 3 adenylate cyclase
VEDDISRRHEGDVEEPRQRRKLSAILMADVSGFSRLMGADEERTVALIEDFHVRVKGLVERHEGRVVDTAGDSVFGEFASVLNAVTCAREIQRQQTELNGQRDPAERIETRIGVHLGDVIVQDYRVYGDGVNIAARLEGIAEPGGICVSEAVYQQVHRKIDLEMEDLGLRELKNIEHPVRVYRVRPSRGVPAPAVRPVENRSVAVAGWGSAFRSPVILIPTIVGVCLLVAPFVLFPTAGVFPTAGSVLLGLSLGRGAGLANGRRGGTLLGLGAGLASGALWTNWSAVTNFLFVTAGAIVAGIGVSRSR